MRVTKTGGAPLGGPSPTRHTVLVLLLLLFSVPAATAAEAPAATPPAMDNIISSRGWLQEIVVKLEDEAIDDVHMLPETRRWRANGALSTARAPPLAPLSIWAGLCSPLASHCWPRASPVAPLASALVASCGCGPTNRAW